jgi:putative DNA methylase
MDWLRSRGWKIYAAVLLSTHIHILMRNETGRTGSLSNDIGQFKNYTARACNKLLKRKDSFWAREHFDHWIRTNEKFEGTVRYIAMNPVKARRVNHWQDWPWTIIDDSVTYCLKQMQQVHPALRAGCAKEAATS